MKYYKAKNEDIILVVKSDNYTESAITFSGEVVQQKNTDYVKGEIRSDWTVDGFVEVANKKPSLTASEKEDEDIIENIVEDVTPSKKKKKPFPTLVSLKKVTITLPKYHKALFNIKNNEFVFVEDSIRAKYNILKKAYEEGLKVTWIARNVLDPKVAITALVNGNSLYDEDGNRVEFDGSAFIVHWGEEGNPQWDFLEKFDNLSKERV